MRKLLPIVLLSLACARARMSAPPERFDKPDEAAAYEAMRHAAPAGVDPQERYATARARMERMAHYSTVVRDGGRARIAAEGGSATWQFLGPGNIGGRTRALMSDHTHGNLP